MSLTADLYLSGMTLREVAEYLGMSQSGVAKRLDREGIKRRAYGTWSKRDDKDRFYEKMIPEPNSGCWLWLAGADQYGYGKFHLNGKKITAQRASYILHVGDIPQGHEIDHLCKNPTCVNPDHLRAVTKSENLSGRRSFNGSLTHCRRGHPLSGSNLRVETNGARRCLACVRLRRHERSKNGALSITEMK